MRMRWAFGVDFDVTEGVGRGVVVSSMDGDMVGCGWRVGGVEYARNDGVVDLKMGDVEASGFLNKNCLFRLPLTNVTTTGSTWLASACLSQNSNIFSSFETSMVLVIHGRGTEI